MRSYTDTDRGADRDGRYAPPGGNAAGGGAGCFIKALLLLLAVLFIIGVLLAMGAVWSYNSLQERDEGVKAAWSQVINVYKRRADLIPNLVSTVQGYVTHERELLTELTAARAKVGGLTVDANDAQSLAAFQAAQNQLQGALGRLLAVTENYPDLKASANFLELQAQIEGSENRVTVERRRYIQAVADYNIAIRTFPRKLIADYFGFREKPNFTVENEAAVAEPPKVDFGGARK
jgi:LemA protein